MMEKNQPAGRPNDESGRDGRFRWMAEGLTRAMQTHDPGASPIFHEVVAYADPGGRVLDVGAGVGRFAVPLARAGRDVIAVEPAPVMCERLRRHVAEAAVEQRVRVVEGAWPAVDVPAVDVALGAFVLQFAEDPVGFVRAMEQVARRRVVLALHVDPLPMAELRRLLGDEAPRPAPLFADLYPRLEAAGIRPRVQFMEDDHVPPLTDEGSVDRLLAHMGLDGDPDRVRRVKAFVAERVADGSWTRPRRSALLSWTPGEGD
jgi:SAM-dependent methyltransferase